MPVDSFKWLPRAIAGYYQSLRVPKADSIPWTPLKKPVRDSKVALLTSAGIYLISEQEPFDLDRERNEPFWGDPTYRVIPNDVRQEQIGVAHLHINNNDIHDDLNIVLPVQRINELAESSEVGSVAAHHYSFMGYQQDGAEEWRGRYGSEVAQRMIEEEVDVALLTPA